MNIPTIEEQKVMFEIDYLKAVDVYTHGSCCNLIKTECFKVWQIAKGFKE